MVEDGYIVFHKQEPVLRWAAAAHSEAIAILRDPERSAGQFRHRGTWFVGVDILPNQPDGSIRGVPLAGRWADHVDLPASWHPAQLSVVFPGYPARDPEESEGQHRFRRDRFAAHVDGLLPVGPERRRFLREPHAFILGLPLTDTRAAPLMVYPGSHRRIAEAFRALRAMPDPGAIDVTDIYTATRREIFREIEPVAVNFEPGQAILMHRHLLHGVAPWNDDVAAPREGRMIAYFRPQFDAKSWVGDA
jgi:hypothetical protein